MADLPSFPVKPGDKPIFRLVKICNRNDFPLADMYDGVPYLFEPNKPLSIPLEAAAHFFAWPSDDQRAVHMWIAKRHGWNTARHIARQDETGKPYPGGKMLWEIWVEKVEIAPVEFDLVQRDPDAPIPAIEDHEDAEPAESDDLPMPSTTRDDIAGTRVGKRKRSAVPHRAPRRVDV
jgi:hypothetical protein